MTAMVWSTGMVCSTGAAVGAAALHSTPLGWFAVVVGVLACVGGFLVMDA